MRNRVTAPEDDSATQVPVPGTRHVPKAPTLAELDRPRRRRGEEPGSLFDPYPEGDS